MFQKLRALKQSEMLKNGITLLSASTLSQLIAFIIYPIITRQYSPDELGVLSLFLSIVGIGTILASGKYELAIMVEKKKKDAAAAFDISFIINISLCLISLLLILLFKPWMIETFHLESISFFMNYIPLLIFLSTLGFVVSYWFNRNKKFYLSARYNIVQSTVNSSLKVGFGALGFTQWGLIASSIIGQAVGVIAVFLKKSTIDQLFVFNKLRMKKVAIKQANFPKYTLPHSFVNTLANNLPIMILAAYFNMTEVGLFSLGLTLGFKPISIFTASINQVFFQKTSQNTSNGINTYPILKSFCIKTFLLALPFFVLLYFILPFTVEWLFGAKWIKTAEYLQLMLPWFLMALLASSLCYMPAVVGKQRIALFVEIIYTICRISALLIGVWLKDIKLAVLLFSLVNTLFISGSLTWFLYLAKHQKL